MKLKKIKSDLKIMRLAKNINALASKAFSGYSPEVDAIIDFGCKDRQRIETTLDWMLDFCWDKKMLKLFKKLCRYYYEINPRVTAEYVIAYRDLWDNQ